MVREFVRDTKKVAQKIDVMFEQAAYNRKLVTAHFAVRNAGEKDAAIISHITLDPVNIEINDNMIILSEGSAIHNIDISKFAYIKCDDECTNNVVEATIDMECENWCVHFDII